MFPTAGYFRSTNCPFFVHGLCHRPYCHFRHSKPGLKNSKSKISPRKHKTEEHHSAGDSVQHVSKVTVAVAASDAKTGNSHQSHDEDKYKTTPTTAIKSILKKLNEETSQQSSLEDSLTEDSSDKTAAVDDSARPDRNSIESFDDTEQPFASLTDEEKQIIGLISHPSSVSNNVSTCKSSDAKINAVSNAISVSSFDNKTSVSTNIENEAVVSSETAETNLNDACRDVQVKEEAMKDISEKALLCSDVKEKMADELLTDSCHDHMEEKHDLTVTKEKFDTLTKEKSYTSTEEKSDKILSRKRKSVQLKTTTTTTTTKETLLKGCKDDVSSSDVILKKRKSQQLPCLTDAISPDSSAKGLSEDIRELKHSKGNDSCIKQGTTTLDQFLKSASKSFQQIEFSKKSSSHRKDSMPKEAAYIIPKKHKLVVDGAVTLKRKNAAKEEPVESTHGLKKKVNISDADINFFGSTKKAPKSSKVEKQTKSTEKASPVKTPKGSKLEARGVVKCKDLKQKFSKGVTMLISDESDALSPANHDSSSEEDNQLKRIWDEYEPQHDTHSAWVEDLPVKSPVKELLRKKVLPTAAAVPLTTEEKQSSMADTLGLGKKQRVAHSANHLPRRLSSNANPIRRYPKTLSAVQGKQEPSASSTSVESPVKAAATSYKPVKQRVAHVVKKSAPAGSLPRPRIPVEYGAKVPQNQRQRYLDRIIDEYLRIYPTEKEAYEKAVEEEQALYERSTRRQVYLNLCVNAIKKLRDMKPLEIPSTSPVKTETVTRVAVTKTLPSGAVLISTKSPVKQDQPVRPASDELTEEVMYDFLSKYLMSEEDLVENGYPRPCPTSPGKAVIKTNKEQPSKDSSRRICRRCGKPFVVLEDGEYLTREECVYHAGRLFRRRGEQSYSCCQGDAGTPGCCVGKVHVNDDTCNTDGFMTTIVSPLADQRKKLFAMDCEMCYTTAGLELTRITVVNWNLEGVYDTFVMPERPIVDYNTRFSGVTEELLRDVTTTIREVQAVLLSMIHKDTILVGHSLESDLKATKLIHSKVVDTSIVFPHRLGRPYKRALRNLMADYLKKIIQDSVEGHDSHEDARACLELMRMKVKEDMKRTSRHKSPRLSLG